LTMLQLLVPFAFSLVIWILQLLYSTQALDGNSEVIGYIPKCKGTTCHTLLYSPNTNLDVNRLMQQLSQRNQPPLRFGNDTSMFQYDVIGFYNETEMIDYVTKFQSRTMAAVAFEMTRAPFINVYTIYFNSSTKVTERLDTTSSILKAIDTSFFQHYGTLMEIGVVANIKSPPTLEADKSDAFNAMGIFWFFCPPTFNLIIFIIQITSEKERKLRKAMSIVGMNSAAYWISWAFSHVFTSFFCTLILVGSGWAFRFDYFVHTHFLVNFVFFFTFSICLIPLAYFLTCFVSKTSTATVIGFLVFLFGLIIQMFFADFPVYIYFKDDVSQAVRYIFALYPPFNFAKIFSDIAYVTTTKIDLTLNPNATNWFSLQQVFESIEIEYMDVISPPVYQSILFLLMNTLIFTILFFYFDNVIAGDDTMEPKPFYFLLMPSFWGIKCCRRKRFVDSETETLLPKESTDVQNEKRKTLDSSNEIPLRILGLTKKYRQGICKTYTAVNDLYLGGSMDHSHCLSILGINGAGKTSLINMLTGSFSPTSGTATIFGYDICDDMDQIRSILGVCHQFDCLWGELTPREHLEIYAQFKNVGFWGLTPMIDKVLKQVELFHVANQRSDTFSGGMQRRLSLAIACIGDPKMIIFDEPTSGLDVITRKSIWKMIEQMKQNRMIVLTTHSMQEADVLSDSIAIMAYGKLRCIGDSIHLKNLFGIGCHLDMIGDNEICKTFVKNNILLSSITNESNGNVRFWIQDMENLPGLLGKLEKKEIECQWSLSKSSLEDVFFKITKEAHEDNK
jgi:ABC-type multidrug transport system ATPase subunit